MQAQYRTDKNQNTTINLNERFSINKLGFGNWIHSNCAFRPGMRILELGCGNGSAWPEYIAQLPHEKI